MSKGLVLITGGNGSLGFACILHALKAGFRVRTTVRREDGAQKIKASPLVQQYLQDFEVVLVPDITVDDAFSKALEGVGYVIHVASPMPKLTNDFEGELLQPAIRGTTSVLKSANKVPSVKRVVITSSIAVLASETEIRPKPEGPPPNLFMAYVGSKVLAYHATKEFVAEQKPSFSVVSLRPSYVIGRNEIANSTKELEAPGTSNGLVMGILLGKNDPTAAPKPGYTVHIDDTAAVHVKALTSQEIAPEGEDFTLTYPKVDWDDAIGIVKKRFPQAVEKGVFPLGGHIEGADRTIDGSKAEKVFGFRYKTYEEQTVDLVGQYLELAGKK